jgi:tetratricopeptide (TPR) repeat protein
VTAGFAALQAGHAADAHDRFDEYRRRFPNGVLEAEAVIGTLRADQALGHPERALQSIDRALALAPERRGELWVLQGELLLAKGEPVAARAAFDRALELRLSKELLDRANRGRAAAGQ